MAATSREGKLAALMQAALALPILAVPARAAAAEVGEVGFTVLGYKERGLMKVTEPVLWGRAQIADVWEVEASGAVDIITGASPQVVTNRAGGTPVNTLTGASISDRRTTGDAKVSRRIGDFVIGVSRALSHEEDYNSRAFGVDARWDLNERNTTLNLGYGKSNDRVRSSDDFTLDERRDTKEYLFGFTQVLSPVAVVQSTVTMARGVGWYNDPYKLTLTFTVPGGVGPVFLQPDRRPSSRDTVAWLTRYRRHFPDANASLQVDYRFYRDDWGIRAHTLEAAWQKTLDERWSVRPALRYYTQGGAEFYGNAVPISRPAIFSSDQRLGAFGGLSPSLRVGYKLDRYNFEATLGYVYNARALKMGGSGSESFETLRAVYGIMGVSREF